MLRALLDVFSRKTEQIASAAFVLGVASLASRLVGVLRDRLLASHFGAGPALDAYYAAFRWPDALYNLLIVGALTAGFIPVLSHAREKDGEVSAARLAGSVLTLTAMALVLVAVVLLLVAPGIIPWTVSGFSSSQVQETVVLTRIMALSPIFLGLSAVIGGILQTHKRFLAFAFAPIAYNLGIICGIVFLAPTYGIRGVAWGVVLGACVHLLIQALPLVRTQGVSFLALHFRDGRIRQILRLMGPRTAGLAMAQINLLILLAFASVLPDGSVSVLAFAHNVQSVPLGLVGISFAVAALPALAHAASRHDREETTRLVRDVTRQILVLVIPMAAWLILLRAQVVRILLGHGSFDWDDTIRTALLVGWLALSLPAQALVPLFARVWYAHHNAWVPFLVGVVAELINIGAAFMLRDSYGVAGLAMAFSLAAFVQVLGLWWLLYRRGIVHMSGGYCLGWWKVLLGLGVSLVCGYAVRQVVGTVYPLRLAWQVWLQGALSGLVCILSYACVLHTTRLKEWQMFREVVLERLWRRTKAREEVDATESSAASM